jgi:hypothetical protein
MGSGGSKPANTNAPKTVLNTITGTSPAGPNTVTVGQNTIPIPPAYKNNSVRNNRNNRNTRNNRTNMRNNRSTPNNRNTPNNTVPNIPSPTTIIPTKGNNYNRPNNYNIGNQRAGRRNRKSANRKSPGGSRRRR